MTFDDAHSEDGAPGAPQDPETVPGQPADPGADALLWRLADVAAERRTSVGESPPPGDAELVAYRAGALDPLAARRVEWALAHDRALRQRLLELAGLVEEAPPADVRRRVLAALTRPASPPARRGWRPGWRLLAAAAVVLLAVGLTGGPRLARWQGSSAPTVDLSGVDFDIRLELGATVRSGGGGATEQRSSEPVEGAQRLRIVIEPRDVAVAGIEVGLYRLAEGGRWRRLPVGQGIELEANRGSATFSARAEALVGSKPGPHDILVAVAPEGRLPDPLSVAPGEDPAAALARRSAGQAVRHTITLRDPSPGSSGL